VVLRCLAKSRRTANTYSVANTSSATRQELLNILINTVLKQKLKAQRFLNHLQHECALVLTPKKRQKLTHLHALRTSITKAFMASTVVMFCSELLKQLRFSHILLHVNN